jgi:ElaB/YqjD/DUF883 family membrane-anchored ribosome-binding protein
MNNPSSMRDNMRDAAGQVADSVSAAADSAARSTQRAADGLLDGAAHATNGLRADLGPMLSRAQEQVSDYAHRGADAVLHSAHQMRDSADAASNRARGYIKDDPVKAVLIAAATGAALMALVSMVSHARHRV